MNSEQFATEVKKGSEILARIEKLKSLKEPLVKGFDEPKSLKFIIEETEGKRFDMIDFFGEEMIKVFIDEMVDNIDLELQGLQHELELVQEALKA